MLTILNDQISQIFVTKNPSSTQPHTAQKLYDFFMFNFIFYEQYKL